jgi:hypothetical protein
MWLLLVVLLLLHLLAVLHPARLRPRFHNRL